MNIFLDTADIKSVERWWNSVPLSGVTTNPSIIAKSRIKLDTLLPALRNIIGSDALLFAQTLSDDHETILKEAIDLNRLDEHLIVKIPVTEQGLMAIRKLNKMGISTLGTAVYTPMQGIMAALAGAEYIAPYVNRIDVQGGSGITMVRELQELITVHQVNCNIIAASFKTPRQALDCLLTGCSSVTLPVDVLSQMIMLPAVTEAIENFKNDWDTAFQP